MISVGQVICSTLARVEAVEHVIAQQHVDHRGSRP